MLRRDKIEEKKYAFKIAYLGENYYGFERQIGSPLPTIESNLFNALQKVNLIEDRNNVVDLDYSKSGRTDKGVSAAGNVISIKLKITSSEEKSLISRINSALPKDIAIIGYK